MERLTKWNERLGRYTSKAGCVRGAWAKLNHTLGAYEETGLTSPEIQKLKDRDTAMKVTDIHTDEYYCPACGAENCCDNGKVKDMFCPKCGQRLKIKGAS